MRFHSLAGFTFWKAVIAGAITAVLTAVVGIILISKGIAPFPAPPSLLFAQVFMENASLPIGFLFHFAYVVFWSIVFVSLFREKLTFLRALLFGFVLWLVAITVFFPIVGWGFFGSPAFMIAALLPHFLFALFLWGSCKILFREGGSSEKLDDWQNETPVEQKENEQWQEAERTE